jgi:hypothetical protein
MMRHACGVLIHVFTILLAPYFLHFCDSWIAYGRESETCPARYVLACMPYASAAAAACPALAAPQPHAFLTLPQVHDFDRVHNHRDAALQRAAGY